MASKDLTAVLKKTKTLVLGGVRGQRLADQLGVSVRTAHGYIQRLVLMGELRDITSPPNSTPRVYDDAKKRVKFQTIPSVEESDPKKRVGVPSTNDSATSLDDPQAMRFHCTGAYICMVSVLGDHTGRISDGDGLTVGGWSDVVDCNRSMRQYGFLRLPEGDDLKFTLYLAKSGPKLTVTPQPRDVYYKTANTEGPRALWQQVYSLLNLLNEVHGWEFGQILYKGTNHGAILSGVIDPLLKYCNLGHDADNAPYHVDTSTGTPEIEVYYDHDGAQADANLIYELPQRFASIDTSLSAIYDVLKTITANIEQLSTITTQLTTVQTDLTKVFAKSYQIPPFEGRGYF